MRLLFHFVAVWGAGESNVFKVPNRFFVLPRYYSFHWMLLKKSALNHIGIIENANKMLRIAYYLLQSIHPILRIKAPAEYGQHFPVLKSLQSTIAL